MENRIKKYSLDYDRPFAKCVVVSDEKMNRVILSYRGNKMLWEWTEVGLKLPGGLDTLSIHPLAAEALITEQISQYMSIEKIAHDETIFINPEGVSVDCVEMSPPEIGNVTFEVLFKKEKVKELYERYVVAENGLTEEIVGEAIACGVLNPLLSLVNLE